MGDEVEKSGDAIRAGENVRLAYKDLVEDRGGVILKANKSKSSQCSRNLQSWIKLAVNVWLILVLRYEMHNALKL